MDYITILKTAYLEKFNEPVTDFSTLPKSGSNRVYIKLSSDNNKAIGTYNTDLRENSAFLAYSFQLKEAGINVPDIFYVNEPAGVYMQEYLGEHTLYSYMQTIQYQPNYEETRLGLYEKIVDELANMQVNAPKTIDFSYGFPRDAFDRQSMKWDLNYFKYYFLKLADVPFYEQDLENDFNNLIDFLLEAENKFFLFRDFQSRNIMFKDGKPYFIDYQGGRRGALQYDLASLLYDAKAKLTDNMRSILLKRYTTKIEELTGITHNEFMRYWLAYILIRIMQAMGAYGFRGFFERKTHFLQSIPPAQDNLRILLKKYSLPVDVPHLKELLEQISVSEKLREYGKQTTEA